MIFKSIESKDKQLFEKVKNSPSFGENAVLNREDIGSDWDSEALTAFDEFSSITSNGLIVNDSFFINYISKDGVYSETSLWNTMMSRLQVPFNREDEEFKFYLDGTEITEALVVSFDLNNAEKVNPKLFFMAFSEDANDNEKVGLTFDLTDFFVLVADTRRENISDTTFIESATFKSTLIGDVYHLVTSSDANFLSVDESIDSIDVDLGAGLISVPKGLLFVDLGIALIFPEKMTGAVENAIKGEWTSTEDVLSTLKYLASYNQVKNIHENYFLRMRNNEFNRSNNSTAYTFDGIDDVYNEYLEENPTTFITQATLYNDINEALGVVTFNPPIRKDDLTERTIRAYIDDNFNS